MYSLLQSALESIFPLKKVCTFCKLIEGRCELGWVFFKVIESILHVSSTTHLWYWKLLLLQCLLGSLYDYKNLVLCRLKFITSKANGHINGGVLGFVVPIIFEGYQFEKKWLHHVLSFVYLTWNTRYYDGHWCWRRMPTHLESVRSHNVIKQRTLCLFNSCFRGNH